MQLTNLAVIVTNPVAAAPPSRGAHGPAPQALLATNCAHSSACQPANHGCLQDWSDAPLKGRLARLVAPFGIRTWRQFGRAWLLGWLALQACTIIYMLVGAALHPEMRTGFSVFIVVLLTAASIWDIVQRQHM